MSSPHSGRQPAPPIFPNVEDMGHNVESDDELWLEHCQTITKDIAQCDGIATSARENKTQQLNDLLTLAKERWLWEQQKL